MLGLFIFAQILGVLLAPLFFSQGMQAFGPGNENDVANPLIYIGIVLVFTFVILYIAKKKKKRVIKYVFLFAICITMMYVFTPIIDAAVNPRVIRDWDEFGNGTERDLGRVTAMIPFHHGDTRVMAAYNDTGAFIDDSGNILDTFDLGIYGCHKIVTMGGYGADHGDDEFFIAQGYNDTGLTNPDIAVIYLKDMQGAGLEPPVTLGPSLHFFDENLTLRDVAFQPGNFLLLFSENNVSKVYTLPNHYITNQSQVSITAELLFLTPGNHGGILADPEGDFSSIVIYGRSGISIFSDPWNLTNTSMSECDFNYSRNPVPLCVMGDLDGKKGLEICAAPTIREKDISNRLLIFDLRLERQAKVEITEMPDRLYAYDVDPDGITDVIIIRGRTVIFLFYTPHRDSDFYGIMFANYFEDPPEDFNGIIAVSDLDNDDVPDFLIGAGDKGRSTNILRMKIKYPDPGERALVPCFAGPLVAILLTAALVINPEWYVIDAVGVVVAAGAIAIFGISLGILPAMVLLIALAVYDAISVYRTKHMIDLADNVIDLKLPILLVVPKKRGYSFKEQEGIKKELKQKKDRDAMFMGLGDVIIPTILGVSAITFLPQLTVATLGGLTLYSNLAVGIFSFAGAIVGYLALMRYVAKGNPQAGLPLLNSGAIGGYIIGYLIFMNDLSFGIVI